jgi:hypothetical protein
MPISARTVCSSQISSRAFLHRLSEMIQIGPKLATTGQNPGSRRSPSEQRCYSKTKTDGFRL